LRDFDLIVTVVTYVDKKSRAFDHFYFSIARYRPPIADVIFPM